MPQLHIITLPQRRQQVENEMLRVGVDAVYWPAIVNPHNTINAINRSHKMIVSWARDNRLPEIFIAEDDIEFTSIKSWKYFLDNKPQDFDIYLGNHYSGIKLHDGSIHGFTGFTIYCVAQRFYNRFLSVSSFRNIDASMAGLGIFKVCSPEIAKQRTGYSYHRKKIVNDDHYLSGKLFLTD